MFLKFTSRRAVAAAMALAAFDTSAKEVYYFNPAFLGDDPTMIADLSRFEKGSEHLPGTYRVDVFVNQSAAGAYEFEFRADQKSGELYPCLSRADLAEFNVLVSAFPGLDAAQTCLNISEVIPGSATHPALDKLRLDVSIPQASLRPEFRGYIPPERWDNGIIAGYVNYQYSGNETLRGNSGSSQYLNLQGGINVGPWRLRDYSTYSSTGSQREWNHISTVIQRTFPGITSVFTAGDTYSSGDVFDSVRLRGATLETDESMRPQSLQGFAPAVRGIARSAAKVSIKQNGYEIYQTNVPPGPFEITDFYPSSSSGDLEVSVVEEDGQIESFIVPYSSLPSLQREWQKSYSLSLGRLDGTMTTTSGEVAQAHIKWGLPAGVTLYGGIQASNNYRAYAMGAGKNLGVLGAFSGDVTHATTTLSDGSAHSGQSMRFLYAKSLNTLGTTFQLVGYRYSTEGFYTLNESTWEVLPGMQRYAKKGQAQASVSQRMGYMGSLYLSLNRQNYWNRSNVDQSMQFGFNSAFGSLSYGVAYSESYSSQGFKDRSVALNFSLPLGSDYRRYRDKGFAHKASASAGSTFERDGTSRHTISVGGSMLDSGKLSYNVYQSYDTQGGGTGTSGSLGYRGKYGDGRLGYSHSSTSRRLRADFSGGILVHEGGITAGHSLGETNILVDTNGAGGVVIEGVSGAETNMSGHAIVPSASPYRENRVSLDTMSFHDSLEAEETISTVVPGKGAIVKASFIMRKGRKALITLTRNGEPLPFGTLVSLEEEGDEKKASSGIVGDDGEVFMSGLPDSGRLLARWGKGNVQTCVANYTLGDAGMAMPVINARCQ